jgi:hypothetical protein
MCEVMLVGVIYLFATRADVQTTIIYEKAAYLFMRCIEIKALTQLLDHVLEFFWSPFD